MDSHLDNQLDSHLSNPLLSLAEYSNKYHVSISTLRRKIRAGKLYFSFKNGKYFLKDQDLTKLKKSKSFSKEVSQADRKYSVLDDLNNVSSVNKDEQPSKAFSQKNDSDREKTATQKQKKNESFKSFSKIREDKKDSFSLDLLKQNVLLNKIADSQKELLKQVTLKEVKITEQQNRIMELNTLVTLLEKENTELKSLLYQEKQMEEWLEIK